MAKLYKLFLIASLFFSLQVKAEIGQNHSIKWLGGQELSISVTEDADSYIFNYEVKGKDSDGNSADYLHLLINGKPGPVVIVHRKEDPKASMQIGKDSGTLKKGDEVMVIWKGATKSFKL